MILSHLTQETRGREPVAKAVEVESPANDFHIRVDKGLDAQGETVAEKLNLVNHKGLNEASIGI